MSYQAPMILLVTVGVIILVYGRLCRRQKVADINYPSLVLLVNGQDDFLEGLLRYFFLWSHWNNAYWQLQVIAEQPSAATLAILHHFFAPYSCHKIVEAGQEMPLSPLYPVIGSELIHYLDIRGERNFKTALQRLRHVFHNNELEKE